MSDNAIIQVEGLGKKYRLRHQAERYTALRDVLAEKAKRLFRRNSDSGSRAGGRKPDPTREDFWALRDVSFEVKRGEVVGIIGRNGAGKSTLLKILSRITEPTEGRVRIRGRVASLLEVGTGFHPELTGRENIFLNGAILGMARAEIKSKFDQIVDFAEIEKFLDTPVKRYSSGMYVRLAFAVAAHLEPEILIVDEVLAVGDVEFQKKCLGKMSEVSRAEGRTVLFVSHNMAAIGRLCDRGLWLSNGQIRCIGKTSDAVDAYLNDSAQLGGEVEWLKDRNAPGAASFFVRALRVRSLEGDITSQFQAPSPIVVEIDCEVLEAMPGFRICVQILSSDGALVLQTCDNGAENWNVERRTPGSYTSRCVIPGGLLNTQHFYLTISADIPGEEVFFVNVPSLSFEVIGATKAGGRIEGRDGSWPGVIAPPTSWQITRRSAADAVPKRTNPTSQPVDAA